ncbi:WD40/YVTN/BNR-like repeat-containing protein [Streptomyces sp. NPDC001668]|uniref:WD40/YVTN/BNR-like repeat-containing protein n=1 Tax=unclassified Streptomyces TaxID=2593676 RepID=UPI0036AD6EE4
MGISDEEVARAKNISVEQVKLLRETRGTTNETLESLSTGAIRKALRRLDFPDLPNARGLFRLQQERGDDGRVPAHPRGTAREQARTRLHAATQPETAGVPTGPHPAPGEHGVTPTAGLALARWKWLGPGNIGGRTLGIVIHPDHPERMWAASAGGGVWHTGDAGKAWRPVDDFLANLACGALAMDPSDPDTLYAGTGELLNIDALRGNGVFRTSDGATWKPLPATQTNDFRAVSGIAVSASGEVVLAATSTGLFRSSDPAHSDWTRVLGVPVGTVVFDPSDSGRAVAGALRGAKAWFSEDGGKTWQEAAHSTWRGRVSVAYAAKDPAVVYASVELDGLGGIWRSDDGGRTYQPRPGRGPDGKRADYLGGQGWYGNAVWAGDPTDEDLLVVGGINLWRSTDGGDHLAEISTWQVAPESAHADQHVIVSHPAYDGVHDRTVFFGTDGGVFMADLAKVGTEPKAPFVRGWTELVNNYGVTQFFGGAGNPVTGRIIGGAQDNGSLVLDPEAGTEGWQEFSGGDGGWCACEPADPGVFYGEYVNLNIHRNTDGGATEDDPHRYISGMFFNEQKRKWDWKPEPFRIPDAKDGTALFIAPFVLDPGEPERLLAGGLDLWRTDNAKAPNTPTSGPAWHSIKPRTGPDAKSSAPISALAISPADSDVVWVGHDDGQVFHSTDATTAAPAWRRVGVGGPNPLRPKRYCACITAHPTDVDTAYVSFGGFEPDNLWVTHDGGARWADLSGTLPDAPIRAVTVHPRRDVLLYCGTEVGLFASEDKGATWSPTNEGPTNCSVDDLFWMDETLVCVTHGRGMFEIDLSAV